MPYDRPGTPLIRRYVGAKRDGVELQRRVHDAADLSGQFLERTEVRGRDGERAAGGEILEDRPAERRALRGIGARSELVDQHERIGRRVTQDLAEVLDVRAERREARLDRLLVTDVGEHVVESWDAAAGADGCRHARLRERRQKAERFEQDRLAAGVRAGHEERSLVGVHRQVERNDVHALREQQRMASVVDLETRAGVDELCRRAGVRVGESRAGEQAVELDERGQRGNHSVAMRAQRVGEREQNALDLGQLLVLQLADAISEFDRGGRFDEQRSAGGRRVVHDPARANLSAAAHGNHVPSVAHRHRRIRHAVVRLEAVHLAFENPNQRVVRGAKLAAKVSQRGRGIVFHRAVFLHRLVDRRLDRRLRDQRIEERRQHRAHDDGPSGVAQLVLCEARRAKHGRAGDEIGSVPCRALDTQSRQRRVEVGDRVWTPLIVAARGGAHRGDARVLTVEMRRVGRRRQRTHVLGAKARRREPGDDVEHARELEDVQRVRVHGRPFVRPSATANEGGRRLNSCVRLSPPVPRARWR